MPPGPKSILLIWLDDVAAVDLALYGGSVSMPNLSALASQGVVFDRFYAMGNCPSSRRSAMTGRWWIGSNGDWAAPPDANTPPASEIWIPAALPEHSSALVGKAHIGNAPSGAGWEFAANEHGFNYAQEMMPANVSEAPGTSYWNWFGSSLCAPGALQTTYQPHAVRDALVGGWTAVPFPRLAVVSTNLPHAPFHDVPPPHVPAVILPTMTQRQQTRARYEAMLVAYDTLIGEMIAAVDLAHALVIVVGDNGTPPPAAPSGFISNRCKGTVFERGTRVPCVMGGSGVVNKSRRSDVLAHVVDLWPTCIEWAGGTLPVGYEVDGVSLAPTLLDGMQVAHTAVLLGCNAGGAGAELGAATLTRKLRLVDSNGDGTYEEEDLFDLVVDPTELVDVSTFPSYAQDLTDLRDFVATEAP